MKILITGANGLLGQHLVHELIRWNHDITAIGTGKCRIDGAGAFQYSELDITDGVRLNELVLELKPDLIIHAAAMTQVDTSEENKQACYNINVSATRFLIDAAKVTASRLIYVSTDFIFDGLSGPYKEEDQPSPVNYYGSTKLAAEQAVMESGLDWAIVRTVLVYGNTVEGTRPNILTWVKENLESGKTIRVVSDQLRTPTYVMDLVKGIHKILEGRKSGIYHISGADTMSPYEMAIRTAIYYKLPVEYIEETNSTLFTQPGKRPPRTGFNISKAKKDLDYSPMGFEAALEDMDRRKNEQAGK